MSEVDIFKFMYWFRLCSNKCDNNSKKQGVAERSPEMCDKIVATRKKKFWLLFFYLALICSWNEIQGITWCHSVTS